MKKWVYTACTAVSLAIALGWTAHFAVSAVERARGNKRLQISCEETLGRKVQLFDENGGDSGQITLEKGIGISEPLEPGNYTMQWLDQRVSFWITEENTVEKVTGPAWTDGRTLYLEAFDCGAVTIRCPRSDWATVYYYDLVGEDTMRSLTVYYEPGRENTGIGSAWGLAMGDYRVLEGGQERACINLTACAPEALIDGSSWPVAPAR